MRFRCEPEKPLIGSTPEQPHRTRDGLACSCSPGMRPRPRTAWPVGPNRVTSECPLAALILGLCTADSPSRRPVRAAAAGRSSGAVSRAGRGRSSRSSGATPASDTPVPVERKLRSSSPRSWTGRASPRPPSRAGPRIRRTARDPQRYETPADSRPERRVARRLPFPAGEDPPAAPPCHTVRAFPPCSRSTRDAGRSALAVSRLTEPPETARQIPPADRSGAEEEFHGYRELERCRA